jgi:hypothetical protein
MYSKNQKLKDSQEGMDDIDVNNVVPTVGFNVKEVVFDKLQFLLWDLGGQTNVSLLCLSLSLSLYLDQQRN